MSKNYPLIIFSILLNVLMHHSVYSQINVGGKPYSLQRQQKILDSIAVAGGNTNIRLSSASLLPSEEKKFQTIDNNAERMRAEKIKESCEDCRNSFFGTSIDVDLNIKSEAKVTHLANGYLYRLEIESTGAYGISLHFDNFLLPAQSSLYLFNEDYSTILGAFTHINNHPSKKFSTIVIPGDKITLEYFEAFDSEFTGQLNLKRITHAFINIYEDSYSGRVEQINSDCFIDINCSEGDDFQILKKAVCRIAYWDEDNNLTGHCSGFLINTNNSLKPAYVLTAGHCTNVSFSGGSHLKDRYQDWVFEFDYESFSCGSLANVPLNTHNGSYAVTGAHSLLGAGDYLLLDLQINNIEDYLDVIRLGWYKGISGIYDERGISHPHGLTKKIARASTNYPIEGNKYWQVNWSNGHQAGGASGSPLLTSPDYLAIGMLSKGNSECVTGYDDYYTIRHAWNTYDTHAGFTQGLGFYLDYNLTQANYLTHSHLEEDPDDDGDSGGTPGSNPLSTCGCVGINNNCNSFISHYGNASSIGTANYIIDDFNNYGNSTIACMSAAYEDNNISPNEWYVTGGTRFGSKFYHRKSQYDCNRLVLAADKWNNSNPQNVYGGAALRNNFLMNQEIIFSYDVNLQNPGAEIMFIASNNPLYDDCAQYSRSNEWSIDWNQNQLISKLSFNRFNSLTNGMPQNNDGLYKFATKFVPDDNYTWLWIIIKKDGNSTYETISIDNLMVYFSNNINTNNLIGSNKYVSTVSNTTYEAYNSLTSNATITSSNNVKFISETVTLEDGFKSNFGSSLKIIANESGISNDPNSPSGPLINGIQSLKISTPSAYSEAFNADYSNLKNIYTLNVLEGEENLELKADFIIYPNPAKDQIQIKTQIEIIRVDVIDLSGRINETLDINNNTINTSELPNGVYYFRITTGTNEIFIEKIIIQK